MSDSKYGFKYGYFDEFIILVAAADLEIGWAVENPASALHCITVLQVKQKPTLYGLFSGLHE